MSLNNRNPHGQLLAATPIVAADVISKLAGISGRDAAKVIIAVHALAAATNCTLEDIMRIDALPTGPADAERFDAVEEYFPSILHALQKAPHRGYLNELRLHKRFGNKSSEGNLATTHRSSYTALRTWPPLRVVGE